MKIDLPEIEQMPLADRVPIMPFTELFEMYEGYIIPEVASREDKLEVATVIWGDGDFYGLHINAIVQEEDRTIPIEKKSIKVFAHKGTVRIYGKRFAIEKYWSEVNRRKRIMKRALIEYFAVDDSDIEQL